MPARPSRTAMPRQYIAFEAYIVNGVTPPFSSLALYRRVNKYAFSHDVLLPSRAAFLVIFTEEADDDINVSILLRLYLFVARYARRTAELPCQKNSKILKKH